MILVDTNIPLRIAQIDHPHRRIDLDALQLLTQGDQEQFAMASQSFYEMYVVCTRPATGIKSITPRPADARQLQSAGLTNHSAINKTGGTRHITGIV